jgi:hypothetical protein
LRKDAKQPLFRYFVSLNFAPFSDFFASSEILVHSFSPLFV